MNKVLITGITGKCGKYMLDEMIANRNELTDWSFNFSFVGQAIHHR